MCVECVPVLVQYRECVGVISGSDEEGRVKLPNIEFSYIKQLQQDNSELRTLLEEHQAALAMIMCKYREQVGVSACFGGWGRARHDQ